MANHKKIDGDISIVVELAVWDGKTGVRFIHIPLDVWCNGSTTLLHGVDPGPIPGTTMPS